MPVFSHANTSFSLRSKTTPEGATRACKESGCQSREGSSCTSTRPLQHFLPPTPHPYKDQMAVPETAYKRTTHLVPDFTSHTPTPQTEDIHQT